MARPRPLLVDDHLMVLQALKGRLEEHCDVVGTIRSARELVSSLPNPSIDCVLLDLSMPGRNGLDVLPEVRALQPELKIIAVTMFLDRNVANEAFAQGADGFVPKDAGLEELLEAISTVLEGRRYLSPLVPKTSHRVGPLASHPAVASLSPRQHRIFMLLGEGKSWSGIAEELATSPSNITFHKRHMMEKLGFTIESDLRRFAILLGADQAPENMNPSRARAPLGKRCTTDPEVG